MKRGSCGEQVRRRASLNFDYVDQRSAVGSRPRTTRSDYTALQIYSFFEFEKILMDYLYNEYVGY
jgi:hypothetical protein